MARQGRGVDVIYDDSLDPKLVPHCKHGPTLLFERFVAGESRRFFACSACRDRRQCNFFQWEDDVLMKQPASRTCRVPAEDSHRQRCCRLAAFRQLALSDRRICRTCGLLLLPADWSAHEGHSVLHNVTHRQLRAPTALLRPLEDKKSIAQYLFSDGTVKFILAQIKQLGFKRVLCIGTPRIHEAILSRRKADKSYALRSLLLDIDQRLEQFYSPKQYCRYNMCNHHFFGDPTSSRSVYETFLTTAPPGDVIVLTDPPFGGRVDVIAHMLKSVMRDWKQCNSSAAEIDSSELKMMWFFPYFLESRINALLPSFIMLHYRVDYTNHDTFHARSKDDGVKGRGAKLGSPVRIFTNISPARVKLMAKDGYRFCQPCQTYVEVDNTHCEVCKTCPSKDGRPFVHCTRCNRCVKASHSHCTLCNNCHLADKPCIDTLPAGCHICGDLSHKRRECPNQKKSSAKHKRCSKSSRLDVTPIKKKKTTKK